MDKSLMKERDAFLKRALANPSIEAKKRPESHYKEKISTKKKSSRQTSSNSNGTDITSYKKLSGGSQLKFSVLTRIVRHMRMRHQDGETHPLAIEEILDETSQLNVPSRVKQWLITDALPNNPKIEEVAGKYIFKPPLVARDRKSLIKLLRQHDLKGYGGIFQDHIQESVPHYEKIIKNIENEILRINRQTDKKQIIFYHDKSLKFEVDNQFQQLWRNVSVDGLQDDNIDDYLNKQGIKSMQDTFKAPIPIRKKSRSKRSRATKINDNEHLSHVLQNYDQD